MDKTGIEFTEEMSRLILDGKMVGYRFRYLNNDGCIVYRNSLKLIPFQEYFKCIKYTSFNKGINVGNEWFFSGDIILRDKLTVVLQYNDYEGFFMENKGHKFSLAVGDKKIGSIYDSEKL